MVKEAGVGKPLHLAIHVCTPVCQAAVSLCPRLPCSARMWEDTGNRTRAALRRAPFRAGKRD